MWSPLGVKDGGQVTNDSQWGGQAGVIGCQGGGEELRSSMGVNRKVIYGQVTNEGKQQGHERPGWSKNMPWKGKRRSGH